MNKNHPFLFLREKRLLFQKTYALRKQGFTLVEIILALGIFAFAMVGIFGLVSRGMQSSRESRVEGASAILSGQIHSLLKASYAWGSTYTNNPRLTNFLGNRSLGQIAAGSPEVRTNFYTQDLEWTNSKENAEFEVVTEIRSIGANGGLLVPEESVLGDAITRLNAGAHCVFVGIEISYPANANANRSKRHLSSILTRTTDE